MVKHIFPPTAQEGIKYKGIVFFIDLTPYLTPPGNHHEWLQFFGFLK